MSKVKDYYMSYEICRPEDFDVDDPKQVAKFDKCMFGAF
jgi:hypothetical protein